jgi:hypothetical protein
MTIPDMGKACAAHHNTAVRGVKSARVQCDEIWSFCYAKAKNVPETKKGTGAGLAPFVRSNPSFGKPSRTVAILGNNLTGTTAVTFNGTPATFTVVADTFKATVPTGATTGTIEVTTPSGTLTSNIAFQVLP